MADPPAPHPPARRRRPATAGILCVVATVAGAGWLYLLRDVSALAFGPHVGGALPLQRLAGGDDQPLARLVTAWVPAGLAAGCALAALTGLRRWARAAVAAVTTWLVLAATGAAADAVTANERLTQHVTGQVAHPALWVAAALAAAGALMAASPTSSAIRGRRRPPDATRPASAGPAAA